MTPEFTRIIDIRHLEDKPVTLTASAEECAALAKRFLLVAVNQLEATVILTRDGANVTAKGRLKADFVQSCAVSGEDLPMKVDEPLDFRFVPASSIAPEDLSADQEIEITSDDCDEIEFEGERLDLGEAVAQSLGLAIDPFATGPEANRVRQKSGLLGEDKTGPFAALAALKNPKP
ncbi:YceD family protein [Novosphingobium rosa]|uniref:YceD family protein n=1 Tax=Novosphingobium rosa TaxID=76978 RepID=UPI0008323337|nr:DUF177 domain-containing protein [Novosphingobium rosa]